MLKFLLEKEFKLIFRNKFLPRLILGYPFFALLILPFAANFEIKNINLNVVDSDHSSYSTRLIQKVASSGYFRLKGLSAGYEGALADVESDTTDMILEIPAGFERNLVRDRQARVMISANAVNSTKGGLGSAYLSEIISDYASDLRGKWIVAKPGAKNPSIDIIARYRFNPHLSYKTFMVPGLMVMLLTIMCGFLPALNIVGEKESGTMEQINVTPIGKFTFILSKLIPYWMIGLVILSIGFFIAFAAYGLIPSGHLSTIYAIAAIYILAVSGLGLVISNHSNTMQQAMFLMFFFMMIMVLISGLFTPLESMPPWAQKITLINPLRYFAEVMRAIYLKGSSYRDLLRQICALCAFAVVFNVWAVVSYRKRD